MMKMGFILYWKADRLKKGIVPDTNGAVPFLKDKKESMKIFFDGF